MDEIITINNKDFIVVKRFSYNNETYIYVISEDGLDELMLLHETNENGEDIIESINEEEKVKEILTYMNKIK